MSAFGQGGFHSAFSSSGNNDSASSIPPGRFSGLRQRLSPDGRAPDPHTVERQPSASPVFRGRREALPAQSRGGRGRRFDGLNNGGPDGHPQRMRGSRGGLRGVLPPPPQPLMEPEAPAPRRFTRSSVEENRKMPKRFRNDDAQQTMMDLARQRQSSAVLPMPRMAPPKARSVQNTPVGDLFGLFLDGLYTSKYSSSATCLERFASFKRFRSADLSLTIAEFSEVLEQRRASYAAQPNESAVPIEVLLSGRWVAIASLLANVNALEGQALEAPHDHWEACLRLACERMEAASNCFQDTIVACQDRFRRSGLVVPLELVPAVLRRHRLIFERARAAGVAVCTSTLGNQCRKFFSICLGVNSKSMDPCAARVVDECLAAKSDAPVSWLMSVLPAFEETFPNEILTTVSLRYRLGLHYLEMNDLGSAATELTAAYDCCPDGHENKRTLFTALTACNLGCGLCCEGQKAFEIPELEDFELALRSANLLIYEAALREHVSFLLERGLLPAIHRLRTCIVLQLLVKYFLANSKSHLIDLDKFREDNAAQFDGLDPIGYTQVLPLLVDQEIVGAVEGQSLVLRKKMPFPRFPLLNSETTEAAVPGSTSPPPSAPAVTAIAT